MSQLCFYLPPFSSDYAGACSALFELDGTLVVHDGHCCSANYAGFDEPRWFEHRKPVYCSHLREMDAVLGSDDKLIAKVRSVLDADGETPFIALLGSPAPAIIGADLDGIAAELEAETGIPAFGLSTTGLAYYPEGYAMACRALLDRFAYGSVTGCEKKPGRVVNILGLTPIDFSDGPNAQDIVDAVERAGCSIACTFAMGMTLDDIAHAPSADLNIAVSTAGLAVARFMQSRWGIPYVAATLFGSDRSLFVRHVEDALAGRFEKPATACGDDRREILIVADQILGNAIRDQLEARFGIAGIDVASFFGIDQAIARDGDIALTSEKQLVKLIAKGRYRVLVGDPLLSNIPGTESMSLFALPHVAISSRLFWHEYLRFTSLEADDLLARIAEGDKKAGILSP